MGDPTIAAKQPVVLELEPGTYAWCRCGLSKQQPFCDGSHRNGTGMQPLQFTVDEQRRVALCQCKRTAGPPFCDGSHKRL